MQPTEENAELMADVARDPVRDVLANLRVCRRYMVACAGTLDETEETEALHSLRLSLTTLDDCLDRLEDE